MRDGRLLLHNDAREVLAVGRDVDQVRRLVTCDDAADRPEPPLSPEDRQGRLGLLELGMTRAEWSPWEVL